MDDPVTIHQDANQRHEVHLLGRKVGTVFADERAAVLASTFLRAAWREVQSVANGADANPARPRFLVSLFAERTVIEGHASRSTFHHGARVLPAANQREAEGVALHDLRADKPFGDGWGHYDVIAVPLDR